jgi:hypothetical protein
MNLLFSLPPFLQSKIFEYDNTYYAIYNLCMLELNLNYRHYKEINKMLRDFYRQRIIFKYYAFHEIDEIIT